jgi:hypothetical protein
MSSQWPASAGTDVVSLMVGLADTVIGFVHDIMLSYCCNSS